MSRLSKGAAALLAASLLVAVLLARGMASEAARQENRVLLPTLADAGPSTTVAPIATATTTVAPIATATTTVTPDEALEGFEGAQQSWQVTAESDGGGSVAQSKDLAAAGAASARARASAGQRALLRVAFRDSFGDHGWQERPGTWRWQRASLYVPAASVAALGPGEYLTLGGLWTSDAGPGWFLRVREGGELTVVGHRFWDSARIEFPVYGKVPTGRWFELELGLHSQHDNGVKRAFAFLIDGEFYGWYRQGGMEGETYDRAAFGVLETTSTDSLEVYVDRWRAMSGGRFPGGPDGRSTAALQEQDYRTLSGAQWQIDWGTWEHALRLHPQYGLYATEGRLQSGRNIDRMPDLTSGWAEIEIDWPAGKPPLIPGDGEYFGPMVGFRKDVSREQNLEIIPIGRGGGKVDLLFEAWINDPPLILANWPLPASSADPTVHFPEPGDVIRVRWEQLSAADLRVQASYYDASEGRWFTNVIEGVWDATTMSIGGSTVDFTDGHHTAASLTIDSRFYAIRRFKLGTLSTYPGAHYPASRGAAR